MAQDDETELARVLAHLADREGVESYSDGQQSVRFQPLREAQERADLLQSRVNRGSGFALAVPID